MVKVFCDICEQEITKEDNEFELTCCKADKTSENYKLIYADKNVCENCINKINNFIANNLKPKDGD